MKVVQINCVYGSGSTGKIVATIHKDLLAKGIDSYVLYGMGTKSDLSNVIRVVPPFLRKVQSLRSRITGYPYGGCMWGTAVAINELKRIKPDIVHLQCANGYTVNIYRILEYLKDKRIPTVITNHAEFMYTGGCTHAVDCCKWLTGCYKCEKISKEHPISYFFDRTEQEWKILQKVYTGFDKLVICCVSDWVKERASKSPFFKNYPVETVMNGLDTDIFTYKDATSLKRKLGLDGNKVVLHVTPNFSNEIKGGAYVIEMAKRFPEYEFVIVGSEFKNNTLNNCHFIGKIKDQNLLAQYYSMADVCLLTSVRETFSMVCAESLCCGTVVVGFKSGGPETIALHQHSDFVEHGDVDRLGKALFNMIERPYDKKKVSEVAIKTYDQKNMCNNYHNIYLELLSR